MFIDLQANISPIKGIHNILTPSKDIPDIARSKAVFDPTIFIDGLFIHGHRSFGLPPSEPTYFCKWDFDLGDILINGPIEVLQFLGQAGSSIGYTYADNENAMIIEEPIIYDVIYLTLNVRSLKLRINVDDCVFETSTSPISLTLNDLNNNRYSSRLTICVPEIHAKLMRRIEEVSPTGEEEYEVYASVRTSILITDFVQKRDFYERHEKQQNHIAIHDAPFDRCSFLLDENHRVYHPKPVGNIIPSIPLPIIPPPLTLDTANYIDPNLNTMDDNDFDYDSSVSSRTKYSSSLSSSGPSSYSAGSDQNDDIKESSNPKNQSKSVKFNINGTPVFGNAFMPPESWKKFEKLSDEFQSRLPKFKLNPTSYYSSDEGIVPRYEVDSSTEYDSFVIQVGDVTGFLVPQTLEVISTLTNASGQDLETTLDSLQTDVLSKLNSIRTSQPEVKNFKIVISAIDLKYGTVTGPDASQLLARYQSEISHVAVECKSIDISLRLADKRRPQDIDEYLSKGMAEVPTKITAYSTCDSILLGVYHGNDEVLVEPYLPVIHTRPVFVNIYQICLWWSEMDHKNTAFFQLKDIDFSILNESIPWISSFIELNITSIKNLNQEKIDQSHSHSAQLRNAYVLNLLSCAGEKFKIQDDPSVLTRPSVITRSPKHIRINDSWKIMMRLRHILKSLPSSWRFEHDLITRKNKYVVNLDDAQQKVLKIFGKWRSWELTGMDNSYIFKHVFHVQTLQDTLLSQKMDINVDLESISLRINYGEEENFLCFDYLKFSFGWNKKPKGDGDEMKSLSQEESNVGSNTQNPLEVLANIICHNIRLHLDPQLLKTIEVLNQVMLDYNQKQQNSNNKEIISQTEESTRQIKPPASSKSKSSFPPLKITLVCFFENISFLLEFITVSLIYRSKDIVFNATVEELEMLQDLILTMSFLLHVDSVQLSLSEILNGNPRDLSELFMLSLHDCKGSFLTTGDFKTSTKFASASNEKLDLRFSASVEYGLGVVTKFLDHELRVFNKFIARLDEQKASYTQNEIQPAMAPVASTKSSSAGFKVTFPIFVRFKTKELNVFSNVTESLYFTFSSWNNQVVGKLGTNDQVACEISFTDQVVDLFSKPSNSDSVMALISINVPSITALILAEESFGENFVESIINIQSVQIRMMPISSLLFVFESETIDKEIDAIIGAVELLQTRIKALDTPEKTKTPIIKVEETPVSTKPSKPSHFNLTLSIVSVVALIQSFDTAIKLILSDIHTTLLSFYYDKQSHKFGTSPFIADISVNDTSVDMKSDTWGATSATEIVKLQFSACFKDSDDANQKQRIEITSKYFHVMLCQRILEKLIHMANTIEEGLGDLYPNRAKNKVASTPVDKPSVPLEESINEQFRALKKLGEKMELRMAFSDFAFAWLFEENFIEDQYPVSPGANGMLFGYNSLQIATKNLSGKTILHGVYITPTYDEFNIFTTSEDKSKSMNTAYLDTVRMGFSANLNGAAPHLSIQFGGDSLKITVLPSIVAIIFCLAKSITSTLKRSTVNIPESESIEALDIAKTTSKGPTPTGELPKFSLPISFGLSVSFDGATIALYEDSLIKEHSYDELSDTESASEDHGPALSLQSPALNAKIEYIKGETASKRDIFNAEILITSSNNTIYPKVVPSVVKMWQLIQKVLKKATQPVNRSNLEVPEKDSDQHSVKSLPEDGTIEDINIDKQFSNIVVDINVRLQRQEIMLSCEPKARVAATVSYDDFCISLNSADDKDRKNTYALSVRLNNFNSSLQHVYSREVSGLVNIEKVIIFIAMGRDCREQQSIMVATKISDINLDVNLKQTQDMELFQDIWSPKSSLNAYHTPESVETFENVPDNFNQPINQSMLDGAIMRKYRRVTSTTAIPWRFDFVLMNVKGTADLGQAVGQVTFTLDKWWVSSQKSSNWEQNLVSGFDEIKMVSKGRFGGAIALKKIQLSTAIMWQRHNEAIYPVPLVQAIIGIESIEARATFDFHSFAIFSVTALHLSLFNQRDKNFVLPDRLALVANCDTIYLFASSLAASNILDLYYTIDRIRQEANASYIAILQDSANAQNHENGANKEKPKHSPLKYFERLRTFLDVNINFLAIYIYPDTLMDSQVFTMKVRGAEALYSQEIEIHDDFNDSAQDPNSKRTSLVSSKQFVSHLDMKLHGFLVALASRRKAFGTEEDLILMSVEEYITKAQEAKGNTIIGIPVCHISMKTWQAMRSNVIEYIFDSSFGGRVDVGWNLGSVNFIRSMWDNHVRTFNARRETYEMRNRVGNVTGSIDILTVQEEPETPSTPIQETGDSSLSKSSSDILQKTDLIKTPDSGDNKKSSLATVARKGSSTSLDDTELSPLSATSSTPSYQSSLDDNVSEADKNVETTQSKTTSEPTPAEAEDSESQYVYVARVPPVIAQPQLRDMGEATPPVEWIGLHRAKLPSFVHQAIMVPLEKTVEEVDVVYRKVLGRS